MHGDVWRFRQHDVIKTGVIGSPLSTVIYRKTTSKEVLQHPAAEGFARRSN